MGEGRECKARASGDKNSLEINDLELVVLVGGVDGVAFELKVLGGGRHDGEFGAGVLWIEG